jgi:hypothetical protein
LQRKIAAVSMRFRCVVLVSGLNEDIKQLWEHKSTVFYYVFFVSGSNENIQKPWEQQKTQSLLSPHRYEWCSASQYRHYIVEDRHEEANNIGDHSLPSSLYFPGFKHHENSKSRLHASWYKMNIRQSATPDENERIIHGSWFLR